MNMLLLPPGVSRERLKKALLESEEVARKDRSNLYVVSQFFTDPARYDAFIATYAVMRLIDDRIDDIVDKPRLTGSQRDELLGELDSWEARIRAAYRGEPVGEAVDIALAAAVRTFPVPICVWLNFLDAMRFDVRKSRFEDFEEFLRYGEGATVAPTAVYVYLLTSQRQADGTYSTSFDFIGCGRDLGLFSYIAHILRDLRADLQVGETGLVYLSLADLRLHQMTEADLRILAAHEASAELQSRWRALVHDICARAQIMRTRGIAMARGEWDSLPADCAFIFRLIVTTYSTLLDRIDADPDRVLRSDELLTDEEKIGLLQAAAAESRYTPVVRDPDE